MIGTAGFACPRGRRWDVSFPKLVCQHLPQRLLSLIPNKSLIRKCCKDNSLRTFSGKTKMYVCSVTGTEGKCLRDGTSTFSPKYLPWRGREQQKLNKAKPNHTPRSKSALKKLCQRRLPSHPDEKPLFYFKNWASWQAWKGCACYLVQNEKKYWSPSQTLVFSSQCYCSSLLCWYKQHFQKYVRRHWSSSHPVWGQQRMKPEKGFLHDTLFVVLCCSFGWTNYNQCFRNYKHILQMIKGKNKALQNQTRIQR